MKKNTTFIIAGLLLLASCAKEKEVKPISQDRVDIITSNGAFRSQEEAERLATSIIGMFGDGTKSGHRKIVSSECITSEMTKGVDAELDTLYYVFNYADNEGFTAINANKHMDPFICVTESGSFDHTRRTGVPAVDEYFKNMEKVILRFHPDSIGDFPIEDPGLQLYQYTIVEEVGSSVFPLLKTKWGQTGVYGAFCPNGICGCVATAMGQIMTYHMAPASFSLSLAMGSWAQGYTLSPAWNIIDDHIKNHTSVQSCTNYHDQISALLRDIGYNVYMSYDSDDSSAYPYFVPSGFAHYGYSSDSYSTANVGTIITSLNNHRPVFMGGYLTSSGPGHAWVADGYHDYLLYQNTYAWAYPEPGYYLVNSVYYGEEHALHINWGWNGDCNGYFNFNNYDTANAVQYDEGHTHSYNFAYNVGMITNIHH